MSSRHSGENSFGRASGELIEWQSSLQVLASADHSLGAIRPVPSEAHH